MKTVFCLGISLLGLLASVVSTSAAESEVRVISSRSLRVAAVRETVDSAPWYVIQKTFANSLSSFLPTPNGGTMSVKIVSAEVSTAADDLIKGEYDAVLVLGERLPSDFRASGLYSVRAVSEIGIPVRVFHFVIRTDDSAAVTALTHAFEQATSSVSFQQAMGRASSMRVVADARSVK